MRINASILIPPIVKFTTNVSSGLTPNPVKFTDQSTISPSEWRWNFGDGSPWFNTTNSSEKSPAHTYSSAGTFTAMLIACNAAGCNTTIPGKTITVNLRRLPTAGFSTNVTSETAPLAVKFTDASIGLSLNKWNWSFGDGTWFNTTVAAQKNPAHIYSTEGSYTSRLTVCNSSGCNTTAQGRVIVVTGGTSGRYAYIEAGSGGPCPIGDVDDFKYYLYEHVANHGWQDASTPLTIPIYSTDARVNHWINGSLFAGGVSNNYLDKADFAYFHGHGGMDGYASAHFDNADPDGIHDLKPDRARWGYERGSQIKWITFHSCETLNQSTWTQWAQSFNGLHMILGYDTLSPCVSHPNSTGQVFAQLMRGEYGGNMTTMPIREAWKWANWYSVDDAGHAMAMMYVNNCHDDYLLGFGGFESNCIPSRNSEGNYVISYENWNTDRDTLGYTSKSSALPESQKISLTDGKYSLDVAIKPVPEKIMIYTPVNTDITPEKANKISGNLGMSGKIRKTNSGFGNDPTTEGRYFDIQKDAGIVSYEDLPRWQNSRGVDIPQYVPSDEQAIKRTTEYLTAADLLPKDAVLDGTRHNPTETLYSPTRKEISRETVSVIFHRELNGLQVQNSKILIEIGGNNDIISLFMNWRDYAPHKEVATKPIDEAFKEFTRRRLHHHLSGGEPEQVIVTSMTLKYYSQVAAAAATEKYLQPVYVFEGYVRNGDVSESFEPVYIPATVEQFDNIPGCVDGVCV